MQACIIALSPCCTPCVCVHACTHNNVCMCGNWGWGYAHISTFYPIFVFSPAFFTLPELSSGKAWCPCSAPRTRHSNCHIWGCHIRLYSWQEHSKWAVFQSISWQEISDSWRQWIWVSSYTYMYVYTCISHYDIQMYSRMCTVHICVKFSYIDTCTYTHGSMHELSSIHSSISAWLYNMHHLQ